MIVVKITGGIGNQMFQYALGRNLSIKNNCQLKMDLSEYEGYYKGRRTFQLDVFDIKAEVASEPDLLQFIKLKKNGFIDKVNKKFNLSFGISKNHIIEKQFNFDEKILDLKDGIYLDGYWQSEKYFKDIAGLIGNDFIFKDNLLDDKNKNIAQIIKSANSVAVHVRRGDYATDQVNLDKIGVCSTEYYRKSFEYILGKADNLHFFVFSDDIAWTRENLKIPGECTFVDINSGENGWKDLFLMSQCKHDILANSSFSWWGAWLNTNPEKIILAPNPWFKSDFFNTKDLAPESWIKIDN